jgi:primosomal protein N' (replication factor Y)
MSTYAVVALGMRLEQHFTYSIPEEMAGWVVAGARVLVPFGPRTVTGYVVSTADDCAYAGKVRPITEVLDRTPTFNAELLRFLAWTAEYYHIPLGELMRKAIPPSLHASEKTRVRITEAGRDALPALPPPQPLLELLARVREASLARALATESDSRVKALLEEGLIERLTRIETGGTQGGFETVVRIVDAAAAPGGQRQKEVVDLLRTRGDLTLTDLKAACPAAPRVVSDLAKKGIVQTEKVRVYRQVKSVMLAPPAPERLTGQQEAAIETIAAAAAAGGNRSFLLYGVTGSGKTEVYMRAIDRVLASGRTALVLVPEIALTPQLMARFQARFQQRVAILHSALTPRDRLDQWGLVARGSLPIVLGARSAIFAPLSNIGLIVVDEEHEPSYKQDERPFYNARDLALVRGKLADCPVVLGSATPSLESFHNVSAGKMTRIDMPSRVTPRPLPDVSLVDLRKAGFQDSHRVFSKPLADALQENLSARGQSILFLNRKGFASFLLCTVCGAVPTCPHCAVSLTYYKRAAALRCHYCEHGTPVPEVCPACTRGALKQVGSGTERIVEALTEIVPDARVEQVDSTVGATGRLPAILEKFRTGQIDILVGTQIITKGHDFPGVTLVGVLLADLGLCFPDFRAAERTFQLLTQVAGRSGRGDRPGRVLVQTYLPGHYALLHAQRHDFPAFAREELAARRMRRFPPFSCLSLVRLRGKQLPVVQEFATGLARVFEKVVDARARIDVMGPTPAPLSLVNDTFRLQVLVRAPSRPAMQAFLTAAIPAAREQLGKQAAVSWDVDVDPINLM